MDGGVKPCLIKVVALATLTVFVSNAAHAQTPPRNVLVACATLKEMNGFQRPDAIRLVNELREELGEPPYLEGSKLVFQSLEADLCPDLVMNKPDWQTAVVETIEAKKQAEQESKDITPAKPAPSNQLEPTEDSEPPPNAEQLATLTRGELKALIDADSGAMGTAESSLRDGVAATIRATVSNHWRRPSSARNGMVVVLSIQLVPTGEVAGVSVLRSSGNQAFDRSAITAVEKAGRFPSVAELTDATFETNFREFQLIFKPEDLRY